MQGINKSDIIAAAQAAPDGYSLLGVDPRQCEIGWWAHFTSETLPELTIGVDYRGAWQAEFCYQVYAYGADAGSAVAAALRKLSILQPKWTEWARAHVAALEQA